MTGNPLQDMMAMDMYERMVERWEKRQRTRAAPAASGTGTPLTAGGRVKAHMKELADDLNGLDDAMKSVQKFSQPNPAIQVLNGPLGNALNTVAVKGIDYLITMAAAGANTKKLEKAMEIMSNPESSEKAQIIAQAIVAKETGFDVRLQGGAQAAAGGGAAGDEKKPDHYGMDPADRVRMDQFNAGLQYMMQKDGIAAKKDAGTTVNINVGEPIVCPFCKEPLTATDRICPACNEELPADTLEALKHGPKAGEPGDGK